MDLTQLRSKMTPTGTERPQERPTSPTSSREARGGSWRRKAAVAVAMLGMGLYLRRRRSGSREATGSDGDDGSQSLDRVDFQETDADQSTGRSLGRRLAMMALSTLAFTLARRAFRRFRRAM